MTITITTSIASFTTIRIITSAFSTHIVQSMTSQAIALSEDHKPENPIERNRIWVAVKELK